MKRSVCITTWFGTENYGSNLQALGLNRAIKDLGYETYFIERFRVKGFFLKYPVLIYARVINLIHRKKAKDFFTPVPYRISSERSARINKFNSEHYRVKSFYSNDSWKRAIREGTIFVCGSDIIWNSALGYPALNFLDMAYYANLSRFSYGSSVGASELPSKYYRAYRRYLGSMKAVGVREQAVADMLEPIIGLKPTKVVDPSLLLTDKEWDEYANKAELSISIDPKGFILCYFVMNDPRYWEFVKRIKASTDLQIVVLPMHDLDESQSYSVLLDGTVCEFLWLIKNATFICTDSFHACAASLIYQKEFYLLRRTRKSEDAKYNDFLKRYNLTGRVVTNEDSFTRTPFIDYTESYKKLKKDRDASMQFLEETLAKC